MQNSPDTQPGPFADALDEMRSLVGTIESPASRKQPRPLTVKVDAESAKSRAIADKPFNEPYQLPSKQDAPQAVQSSIGPPSEAVTENSMLDDAKIMQKVATFLDTRFAGPVFISQPIRRKVFVGVYPRFGEILDSQRITGANAKDTPVEYQVTMAVLGELTTSVKGWLHQHDPDLHVLKNNIGDMKKWPKLREIDWYVSRDPYLSEKEIAPLWKQYVAWKDEVTPTEEEMEKYWALVS